MSGVEYGLCRASVMRWGRPLAKNRRHEWRGGRQLERENKCGWGGGFCQMKISANWRVNFSIEAMRGGGSDGSGGSDDNIVGCDGIREGFDDANDASGSDGGSKIGGTFQFPPIIEVSS